jgi:hypothetical protein
MGDGNRQHSRGLEFSFGLMVHWMAFYRFGEVDFASGPIG